MIVSLDVISAVSLTRNLCSIDWCAKNPGGTTAEFKQYFDNLPLLELKVTDFSVIAYFR